MPASIQAEIKPNQIKFAGFVGINLLWRHCDETPPLQRLRLQTRGAAEDLGIPSQISVREIAVVCRATAGTVTDVFSAGKPLRFYMSPATLAHAHISEDVVRQLKRFDNWSGLRETVVRRIDRKVGAFPPEQESVGEESFHLPSLKTDYDRAREYFGQRVADGECIIMPRPSAWPALSWDGE